MKPLMRLFLFVLPCSGFSQIMVAPASIESRFEQAAMVCVCIVDFGAKRSDARASNLIPSSGSMVVLRAYKGWSDHFDQSVVFAPGSSKIEPGITPAQPVTLKWETFTEAADEAGMSRRYGGIHFLLADMNGRKLGRMVADRAWEKAQAYFDGSASYAPPDPLPDTSEESYLTIAKDAKSSKP
jgi:hypothetical protein